MPDHELRRGSPKVSIGIPTYDRVDYLKLAVASALAQEYDNLEVIVSNNASTDGTKEYLESLEDERVIILQQVSLVPMIDNWNACVASATGTFFLLLSDDDLLETSAIRELVAGFENSSAAVGLSYCGGWMIDSAGNKTSKMAHSPSFESSESIILNFFRGKRDIWFCGILYRTDKVLPGFPPEYTVAADSAVWIRSVCSFEGAAFVPKELVSYRVHQGATARTPVEIWEREMTALGQLALEKLADKRTISKNYAQVLRREIRQRIAEYVVRKINSAGKGRPTALRDYQQNLRRFLFCGGSSVLLRGVSSLMLKRYKMRFIRSSATIPPSR